MNTRVLVAAVAAMATTSFAAELKEVASFPNQQVTGVGVSQRSGRIFVNFPYWSDDHPCRWPRSSTASRAPFRMTNGTNPPSEGLAVASRVRPSLISFVCKASSSTIRAIFGFSIRRRRKCRRSSKADRSWSKSISAQTRLTQTIPFGEDVAPAKSYLNDVRIDTANRKAFITDSARGAIIVVDLVSGKARRLFDDHNLPNLNQDLSWSSTGKISRRKVRRRSHRTASRSISRTVTFIITR